MKVKTTQQIDMITDVLCDVCGKSTINQGGCSPEYASLTADWGYGSPHDGDSYEVHLCEPCFFQTLAYLKEQRRDNTIFGDENQDVGKEFGLKLRRL